LLCLFVLVSVQAFGQPSPRRCSPPPRRASSSSSWSASPASWVRSPTLLRLPCRSPLAGDQPAPARPALHRLRPLLLLVALLARLPPSPPSLACLPPQLDRPLRLVARVHHAAAPSGPWAPPLDVSAVLLRLSLFAALSACLLFWSHSSRRQSQRRSGCRRPAGGSSGAERCERRYNRRLPPAGLPPEGPGQPGPLAEPFLDVVF
jgi:hypothetical protein